MAGFSPNSPETHSVFRADLSAHLSRYHVACKHEGCPHRGLAAGLEAHEDRKETRTSGPDRQIITTGRQEVLNYAANRVVN